MPLTLLNTNGTGNFSLINNNNSGRLSLNAPPVPTFNFTIASAIPAAEFSVTGISGFTSTPAFTTPIVGDGSFSSIGTPTGTLSFGFSFTLSIGYYLIFTLYKNGVDAGGSFTGGLNQTYSPLSVSPNDTILIGITSPD